MNAAGAHLEEVFALLVVVESDLDSEVVFNVQGHNKGALLGSIASANVHAVNVKTGA